MIGYTLPFFRYLTQKSAYPHTQNLCDYCVLFCYKLIQ